VVRRRDFKRVDLRIVRIHHARKHVRRGCRHSRANMRPVDMSIGHVERRRLQVIDRCALTSIFKTRYLAHIGMQPLEQLSVPHPTALSRSTVNSTRLQRRRRVAFNADISWNTLSLKCRLASCARRASYRVSRIHLPRYIYI
jgi:hypothetical protein